MSNSQSHAYRIVSGAIKSLAQRYVATKRPTVVAVAGSVGKTSTKLALAHLLSDKRVSIMDDSYNNGLGLYLSVFEQKVPPQLTSPLQWGWIYLKCLASFFRRGPEILIVEYGIDHPGDMDDLLAFVQPDISLLTAVTPEHMEYMKTMDAVGAEETKVLQGAKLLGVYNAADVAAKYVKPITTPLVPYGTKKSAAFHTVSAWHKRGAVASFTIDSETINDVQTQFMSEPLLRQLSGAALVAHRLDVPLTRLKELLASASPAASRMKPLDGLHDSIIIDDSTNFSPDAGVEALRALKKLPAKRRIAILGNMHELGDYEDEGFARVAEELDGIEVLALVGELSIAQFTPYAHKHGFIEGKTLFTYATSVEAGLDFRTKVQSGDIVLIKGPFGGFYLEEAAKKLLKNLEDAHLLTRQSKFWDKKKYAQFGDDYYK